MATPATWPLALKPTYPTQVLELVERGGRSRSLTGKLQSAEWGGPIWTANLTFGPRYPRHLSAKLQGFMAGLTVGAPFGMRVWHQLDQVAPGEPASVTVSGGGQVGRNLVTTGWGADGLVLETGWIFTLVDSSGDRHDPYIVTDDVYATGGSATIPLSPDLLESPSSGATLFYRGSNAVPQPLPTMALLKWTAPRNLVSAPGHSRARVQAESWGPGAVP